MFISLPLFAYMSASKNFPIHFDIINTGFVVLTIMKSDQTRSHRLYFSNN